MNNLPEALRATRGEVADVAAVLAMMDKAQQWLVAKGRVGQWGTDAHSTNPHRISTLTGWARDGGLYLAWRGDELAGALAVGAAPPYIPPVDEPELYITLLVTDRDHAGHGVGGYLLAHARQLAEQRDAELLRVDCYAGDDRALVGYYERQGFVATVPFSVDGPTGPWPGQVLAMRLR